MSFGENLKNVRKQRNITQEELARVIAVEATNEDIENLLNALSLDIQTLLDALETLKRSKEYYAEKEAEKACVIEP